MNSTPSPDDAAARAGADVERSVSEPTAEHHPRTQPASAAQKQALDAAIIADGTSTG